MKFFAVLVILSATALLGNASTPCSRLLECRKNVVQQQDYCSKLSPPGKPPANENATAAAQRNLRENLAQNYKTLYSDWTNYLEGRMNDEVECKGEECKRYYDDSHQLVQPCSYDLPAAVDSTQAPVAANLSKEAKAAAQAAAQAEHKRLEDEHTMKVRGVQEECTRKEHEIQFECDHCHGCCSEISVCDHKEWLSPLWLATKQLEISAVYFDIKQLELDALMNKRQCAHPVDTTVATTVAPASSKS